MSDYISRADAIDAVRGLSVLVDDKDFSYFEDALKALPSADAVQGEWTPFDRTFGRSIWVCSVCKTCTDVPCDAFTQKPIYDYCPNCGARMKGGAE